MNALRLLYIIPGYIFAAGVICGWLTVLCVPLIRRYVERNADKVSKRIAALEEQKDAFACNWSKRQRAAANLNALLMDDARKRAN